MNAHPYTGMHGTVRCYPYTGERAGLSDYTGVVVGVYQGGTTATEGETACPVASILRDVPDSAGLAHGEAALVNFVPDDPAEARRRLEAAGAPTMTVQAEPAPVDHEAMGRGFAHALLTHDGAHFLDRYKVVAMMGEAVGKGIVLGALAYMYDRGTVHQRVLDALGSAIGKGIGSARGGAS